MLAVHVTAGDTYEWSEVLLAKASHRGKFELLTAAWERTLGYARHEISGKTLGKLMHAGRPAAVVAAILDEDNPDPVHLTLRCRSGAAKRFKLHRRFDDYLREVFIVAEETPADALGASGPLTPLSAVPNGRPGPFAV